jgi:hypothetical protein
VLLLLLLLLLLLRLSLLGRAAVAVLVGSAAARLVVQRPAQSVLEHGLSAHTHAWSAGC